MVTFKNILWDSNGNPYTIRANGFDKPKPIKATHDEWTDCVGVKYWVHRWNPGCRDGCAIHAPSYHSMRDWPQKMGEATLINRVCEHGYEHPDPDSFKYFNDRGHGWLGVHTCDNCCVSVPIGKHRKEK
jgi:hypothetical protein